MAFPTIAILAASFVIWRLQLIVYRLYFHPLTKVPGPWLARASHLWDFYWNVIRHGKALHQFPKLHERYGPVVRVAPNEVQISEPNVYQEVIRDQANFHKDSVFYGSLDIDTASVFITDPAQHRERREVLNPLFSKRSINNLEYLLQQKLEILTSKIDTLIESDRPVPLQQAFYCITVDIITTYAFGRSFNLLDSPGFESRMLQNVLSVADGVWIGAHFPWIRKMLGAMPRWIVEFFSPRAMEFLWSCEALVRSLLVSRERGEKELETHRTIFDALLDAGIKAKAVPSKRELTDEAIIILFAGTDTTACTLTYAIYYALTEPGVLEKILAELSTVGKDEMGRPKLGDVEQLPYLTCFIKETLRCSTAIPGKTPRVAGPSGLSLSNGTFIPPGTVISFAPAYMHRDARYFTNPWEFCPERWEGQQGKELEKWLLTFSKGARGCLGINLAYAELYLVLATLLDRYDLQLWETSKEDMEWDDMGITTPKGKLKVLAKKRSRNT